MVTAAVGLVTIAVIPPWSSLLVAGLVSVAVGSSLASIVSDAALSGRCYARRRHLRSPTGGGLLAAEADEGDDGVVDEFGDGTGDNVAFGGSTQRKYDWLAVMRIGAGGVGMALIAVLANQLLT